MVCKTVIVVMLVVLSTACGQSFLSLPSSSPSPSPTPSVPPSSETAFSPSTMSVSTSAAHRAVMGIVSIGGAAISTSQNNIQITGTLQQGKDRMSIP